MKKNKLSCVACVVFLLGCGHHTSENPESREIRFQGNIQDLQTVIVGRSEASFAKEKKVQLYIVEREGVNGPVGVPLAEHFNQMITAADGALRFTDGSKHVYPENPIDVYGYHCEGIEGVPADHLAVPVVVVSDQTTEDAIRRSDFLYVKSTDGHVAGDAPVNLVFGHQFSKIQFNIKTHTPATVHLEALSEIKVFDVVVEGTFNVATGNLSKGKTIDDIVAKIPSPLSNGTSVIILPQVKSINENLFSFTVGEDEFVYSVSSGEMVFEKGKLYKCDIWLDIYPGTSEAKIELNSSISDWDDSEPSMNIVIGKGEDAIVTLDGVAAGVMINRADLYLSSGDTPFTAMDVPVMNNEMKFIFSRLEIDGKLQLKKIHFYTSTDEEFDYYFMDKELRGDDFDRLTLTPPKKGDVWADGIVFMVGEPVSFNSQSNQFEVNQTGAKAYKGRVFSKLSLGKFMWAKTTSQGVTKKTGSIHRDNGMENLFALRQFMSISGESIEQYPAFKACVDLGEGWYLPALNEIKMILANKNELNKSLLANGGQALSEISNSSSTETDSGIGYIGCDSQGRDSESDQKSTSIPVRGVRAY